MLEKNNCDTNNCKLLPRYINIHKDTLTNNSDNEIKLRSDITTRDLWSVQHNIGVVMYLMSGYLSKTQ